MARKGKIKDSGHQDIVDSRLIAGVSYRNIALELESIGFEVSHMAIQRYHESEKERIDGEKKPVQIGAAIEELSENEVFKSTLERQHTIVAAMHERYWQGECRFPEAEVRALKSLEGIRVSREDFKEEQEVVYDTLTDYLKFAKSLYLNGELSEEEFDLLFNLQKRFVYERMVEKYNVGERK